MCNKSAFTLIDILSSDKCSLKFKSFVPAIGKEVEMKEMFEYIRQVDNLNVDLENLDKKYEEHIE